MKTRTRNERNRTARRQRGAVMVEAALVLPLLVVFLGLFVFFHRAYKEKIRIRAEAREAAFSAASRGCPSGSGSGSESSMSTGAAAGSLSQIAGQKGDGTSSAMSFSHGTASASKGATVSWNTAYGPWTKTLKKADSYVYCNENPVVTSAASWLDWGMKQ